MSTITPQDFDMLRIPVPWKLNKDGDVHIFPLDPKERESDLKKARELGDPVSNNISKYMPSGPTLKRLIAHDNNGKEVSFLLKKEIGQGSFGVIYLYEEAKEKDGRYVIVAKPRQFALKVIHDADECRDTSYYLDTKGEIGKTCELISQKCLNPPGFKARMESDWNVIYKKVGDTSRYDPETDEYIEYKTPITIQEVQEKVYPSATGPFFIVMDKEDGDLADLLREYGKNPDKLKLIVQDVWKALNCLITDHKKGYMDLKAANVLYSTKDKKVVIKIGDLGGICDFATSRYDTATFPPPDMWKEGFVGTNPSPCTENTMTWLMALLACRIFGVITRDDESAIYWNGIESAATRQRHLDEILARLTMKVKWAIKDNKFGSLPTTNLLQCFSANPDCRPPFKDMFSNQKWDPPKDCMPVRKPVVPPTAPKVNAVPSGAMSIPVRELQAQIKKAEGRVEQLLGNLGRATAKRASARPQELTYWKRQEEAAEGKWKKSKNELKNLQEKLPAYIKPRVSTPVPQAVLPPSPPMVPRRLQQNVDIKENVILGLMGGGTRSRKTKNTRRKITRRRKSSRKRR